MKAKYCMIAKTLAKSFRSYSCEQSYRLLLNTATMSTLSWYGQAGGTHGFVVIFICIYIICAWPNQAHHLLL